MTTSLSIFSFFELENTGEHANLIESKTITHNGTQAVITAYPSEPNDQHPNAHFVAIFESEFLQDKSDEDAVYTHPCPGRTAKEAIALFEETLKATIEAQTAQTH